MEPELVADKDHSPLGPSSFARVENCTASAILGQGQEVAPPSPYAAEGTMAHIVMEKCLVEGMDAFEFIGDLFQIGDMEEPLQFTAELADVVHSFVSFVRGFKTQPKWIERRLTLPRTKIFGWADVVIIDTPIIVPDLKAGAGVEVSGGSAQVGLYILMALIELRGEEYISAGPPDITLGNGVVVQPRGRGRDLKTHPWTRGALQQLWARAIRTDEAVARRQIKYHASENCRFCPATAVCPQLRRVAQDAALAAAAPVPEVLDAGDFDATQLDEAMRILPALDLWKSRVTEMAMSYLEHGGHLTNAKLVAKRSDRKWVDEAKAKDWLTEKLGSPWQPQKLLTPPMAEQLLPKNLRAEMIPDTGKMLVHKPPNGYTIAVGDDNRPSITDLKAKAKQVVLQQMAGSLLKQAK